jgi:N-methylhydantoinase B
MVDPVLLEIYKSAFHSIAEEMGAALRRTAFSPNIKERRDYSCAVFDGAGRVLAMGDHMPVHLGSMPMSVRAALDQLRLEPGDIAVLNDPFAGGTHLPDITLVMPVQGPRSKVQSPRSKGPRFSAASSLQPPGSSLPMFYVASRAHHADVGGAYPGSMGLCREIYQEGLRIPPVKLCHRGEIDGDKLRFFLANVRTPAEREGDLMAQVAACRTGARRLEELVAKYGTGEVRAYTSHLLAYSERMMRALLRRLPAGTFTAEDFLDDDGVSPAPVRVRVAITLSPARGTARLDFSGSSPQTAGSINAVYAVTYSAVFYVFRCLMASGPAAEDVPATAGLMAPITVHAPEGSVVNARPPAAVAGGNVETSQRIVDVVFRALAPVLPGLVPAASSGTMNNLSIGGIDPRNGQAFAYYETIAGGMGARPGIDGASGIHTHMTNSLNTPVEALEYFYPLRVRRYAYRRGSGGAGRYRGGDGLVREIEFLAPVRGTILADRRRIPPYGLAGGRPGKTGRNLIFRAGGRIKELPGKCSFEAAAGDAVRIETPGGGGWGLPET